MFEYENSARECISVTGIFIVAGKQVGLKANTLKTKSEAHLELCVDIKVI